MDEQRSDSSADGYAFEKRQIIRAISTFEGFPMLNPRTLRIINLMQEQFLNIPKLARILERNTLFRDHFVALSGVPDQGEDSVREAIRALGLLNVKQLVFSFLILPLYTVNDRDEWEHVYTTSILTTNLMKHFRISENSSLPLAALMHDIGVPLLRRFNPQRYDQIKSYARETNQILEDVEEANLHITHAAASGICARKWGLTDDIFIIVSYHHTHDEIDEEQYVKELLVLQYADWIDHHVRGIVCRRPDAERMARYGLVADDSYWINYQAEIVKAITFAAPIEEPMETQVEIGLMRNLFNDYIQHLIAPIGFVEKLRRNQERVVREEEEAEAKKLSKFGLNFDIGKFIKDKLQSKKAEQQDKQSLTGLKLNINRPGFNQETATQVFSRPKPVGPSFDFDQPKPLRLRGDGKVLETATRTFKRPTITPKPDEQK